jgi:hypothetical protein
MSGYNGRRAPNFSQYLEELNTAPIYDHPPAPAAAGGGAGGQTQSQEDLFDVDAELAMFTNAEFLDFDALNTNLPAELPTDITTQAQPAAEQDGQATDVKYVEMLNGESKRQIHHQALHHACPCSCPSPTPASS